jgi:integrase
MTTALAKHLSDYLATRRALGFKLQRQGALMFQFVCYLDTIGAPVITVEAALAWAMQPAGARASWLSARLHAARLLARYMVNIDPRTQVPPADLLPDPNHRATPFIYSRDDVRALMDAAHESTNVPLVADTYRTLIGLLAVTGMRVGEAINLDRDDLDVGAGVLVVRNGKFGKSRELVLHGSTVAAMTQYSVLRDRIHPSALSRAWFISKTGSRLNYNDVQHRFHRLTQTVGIAPRSATCRPRIHDLRHSFAANTLLGWYQSNVDIAARIPLLSTYLGHVNPHHTYWYLTAMPELMSLVAQRLKPIGPPR